MTRGKHMIKLGLRFAGVSVGLEAGTALSHPLIFLPPLSCAHKFQHWYESSLLDSFPVFSSFLAPFFVVRLTPIPSNSSLKEGREGERFGGKGKKNSESSSIS